MYEENKLYNALWEMNGYIIANTSNTIQAVVLLLRNIFTFQT